MYQQKGLSEVGRAMQNGPFGVRNMYTVHGKLDFIATSCGSVVRQTISHFGCIVFYFFIFVLLIRNITYRYVQNITSAFPKLPPLAEYTKGKFYSK